MTLFYFDVVMRRCAIVFFLCSVFSKSLIWRTFASVQVKEAIVCGSDFSNICVRLGS